MSVSEKRFLKTVSGIPVWVVWLFFFLVLLLLKFGVLGLNPHHDEQTYFLQSMDVANRGLNPFLDAAAEDGGTDLAHPPLYRLTYGFVIYLFGAGFFGLHLVSLIFSSFGLLFVFLIGRSKYGFFAGLSAAAMVLFTAQFFSNSSSLLPTALTVFISLGCIYYYISGRYWLYVLFAALCVLHREQLVVLVGALSLHAFVFDVRSGRFRAFFSRVWPVACFFVWIVLRTIFSPAGSAFRWVRLLDLYGIMFKLTSSAYFLFFDDGRWILLFPLAFWVFRKGYYSALRVVSSVLVLLFSAVLEVYFPVRFGQVFLVAGFLSAIVILGYDFVSVRRFFRRLDRDEWAFLFVGVIFVGAFNAISICVVGRYFTFVIALGIIFVNSLIHRMRSDRLRCILLILVILVFVSYHVGDRANVGGASFEDNMEYVDFLEMRVEMAGFIEDHYPGKVIYVDNQPSKNELEQPVLGFVERPFEVVSGWPVESFDEDDLDRVELVYQDQQSPLSIDRYIEGRDLVLLHSVRDGNKVLRLFAFGDDSED